MFKDKKFWQDNIDKVLVCFKYRSYSINDISFLVGLELPFESDSILLHHMAQFISSRKKLTNDKFKNWEDKQECIKRNEKSIIYLMGVE